MPKRTDMVMNDAYDVEKEINAVLSMNDADVYLMPMDESGWVPGDPLYAKRGEEGGHYWAMSDVNNPSAGSYWVEPNFVRPIIQERFDYDALRTVYRCEDCETIWFDTYLDSQDKLHKGELTPCWMCGDYVLLVLVKVMWNGTTVSQNASRILCAANSKPCTAWTTKRSP